MMHVSWPRCGTITSPVCGREWAENNSCTASLPAPPPQAACPCEEEEESVVYSLI